MSNGELLSLQNQINTFVTKLSNAHRLGMERLMCDIGLHSGQVQILIALWESDRLSQAELVTKLRVSPPTVNKMVLKLVDAGFVVNKRCPHDKRLKRVHLTNKGNEIKPKVKKQLKFLEEMILRDFSETEMILLPILLEKMVNNIQTDPGNR